MGWVEIIEAAQNLSDALENQGPISSTPMCRENFEKCFGLVDELLSELKSAVRFGVYNAERHGRNADFNSFEYNQIEKYAMKQGWL